MLLQKLLFRKAVVVRIFISMRVHLKHYNIGTYLENIKYFFEILRRRIYPTGLLIFLTQVPMICRLHQPEKLIKSGYLD